MLIKAIRMPHARISEPDKEKLKIIKSLRNKREDELNFSEYRYKQPAKINYHLQDYLDQFLAKI